jgi:hypothetical protein
LLKIFQLPDVAPSYCEELRNAPANCPIPAQLLGRGTSDVAGTVRVSLPR